METRILTLFDDDDFSPAEEVPKKAVKKPVAKDKQEETAIEASQDKEEVPQPEQEENSTLVADDIPEIQQEITSDEIEAIIEDTATGTENDKIDDPGPDVTVAPLRNEGPASAEDLDKQIRSELVLQDYTALIHRDYPFDVQQASVVQKDKVVSVATTVAEPRAVEPEAVTGAEVWEEVTPLPEWQLDKKYYTIGEVAQLFAVNTSHIRFWTNEFKLKPRTTRKGDRLYSPKDISELRLIHHLVKEKKHTIKGAREKLKAGKEGVNKKLDLKEALTDLKDMLIQIKEQL